MTHTAFSCQMCGQCCQGQGGIVTSAEERKRLARYLAMSEQEFCQLYTEPQGKKLVLRCGFDGFCIFFDQKTACRVHPAKPDVCRAWPFFRGNLIDPVSWELAQDACPGIDPRCSHAQFQRQGLRYLREHHLEKQGRADEANALCVADMQDSEVCD